jgi:hypothetical protein
VRTTLVMLLLSLTTSASWARAPIKPPRHELAKVKSPLLLTDGKGHYLLIANPAKVRTSGYVAYYGNGKALYRQDIRGGSRDTIKNRYALYLRDPRVHRATRSQLTGSFAGAATFTCDDRKTPLTQVAPNLARRLLRKAQLFGRYWLRKPYLLARDEDGIYYYVDRFVGKDKIRGTMRGFRLFVGARGKAKRRRLRNIVLDDAGEIFFGKPGKLLVKRNKGKLREVLWVEGKERKKLSVVQTRWPKTRAMIYRELGPYRGVRLWRPCDDL